MAGLEVTTLRRVFEDGGMQLPDPAPGMGVEAAVRVLANTGRPHLLTAEIRGPVLRGSEQVYTLHRAVGTKGRLAAMCSPGSRAKVQRRHAASKALKSYGQITERVSVAESVKATGSQLCRNSGEHRLALPSDDLPWTF